jgi:hypothetical protein
MRVVLAVVLMVMVAGTGAGVSDLAVAITSLKGARVVLPVRSLDHVVEGISKETNLMDFFVQVLVTVAMEEVRRDTTMTPIITAAMIAVLFMGKVITVTEDTILILLETQAIEISLLVLLLERMLQRFCQILFLRLNCCL